MDNIIKEHYDRLTQEKHNGFIRIKNMDLFYSDMIIDRVIQRKSNNEMKYIVHELDYDNRVATCFDFLYQVKREIEFNDILVYYEYDYNSKLSDIVNQLRKIGKEVTVFNNFYHFNVTMEGKRHYIDNELGTYKLKNEHMQTIKVADSLRKLVDMIESEIELPF